MASIHEGFVDAHATCDNWGWSQWRHCLDVEGQTLGAWETHGDTTL